MYNLYTHVANGTSYDDQRRLIHTIDCDELTLKSTVIPVIRRWVASSNLTYKRIGSNKRLIAHIEPVKGIAAKDFIDKISDRTIVLIKKHNENVKAHNVIIRARNKKQWLHPNEDTIPEISLNYMNSYKIYRSEDIYEHEGGITIVVD